MIDFIKRLLLAIIITIGLTFVATAIGVLIIFIEKCLLGVGGVLAVMFLIIVSLVYVELKGREV